jgi:putative tryptophan/tyrosine transport system substrate-binding protein
LLEIVPALHRLAIISNIGNPTNVLEVREVRVIARAVGVEVDSLELQRFEDIAPAFEMLNAGVGALYICPDALIETNKTRILIFARTARLPIMCGAKSYVRAGGLISYGPNFAGLFQRAADYLDKVLGGTKPADLPIEQPTRFELIINLTTARAIKLMIPTGLLLRADEVIE